MPSFDGTDRRTLELLSADARRPCRGVAGEGGPSAPSVSDRVDQLRDRGVVRRFTVDIDTSTSLRPRSVSSPRNAESLATELADVAPSNGSVGAEPRRGRRSGSPRVGRLGVEFGLDVVEGRPEVVGAELLGDHPERAEVGHPSFLRRVRRRRSRAPTTGRSGTSPRGRYRGPRRTGSAARSRGTRGRCRTGRRGGSGSTRGPSRSPRVRGATPTRSTPRSAGTTRRPSRGCRGRGVRSPSRRTRR